MSDEEPLETGMDRAGWLLQQIFALPIALSIYLSRERERVPADLVTDANLPTLNRLEALHERVLALRLELDEKAKGTLATVGISVAILGGLLSWGGKPESGLSADGVAAWTWRISLWLSMAYLLSSAIAATVAIQVQKRHDLYLSDELCLAEHKDDGPRRRKLASFISANQDTLIDKTNFVSAAISHFTAGIILLLVSSAFFVIGLESVPTLANKQESTVHESARVEAEEGNQERKSKEISEIGKSG